MTILGLRDRPLGKLRENLLANFAGTGWSAVVGLVFTPIYLRILGIEAYGLLGFYAALLGVLQLLDLGVSQTVNRELARYSALPGKAEEARDLVRSLEIGYWVLGLCIGLAIWFGAPLVADRWIQPVAIAESAVEEALRTMGLLAVLQWPSRFYQGGLMGLQRQTVANAVNAFFTTVKHAGAAGVLWFISPTIAALLRWQVAVSFVQVAVMLVVLWRLLPGSRGPARVRLPLVKRIGPFAAGLSGITVTAIIITNLDKVVLSRSLTLVEFGYYTLAVQVANSLQVIVTPVFNAVFPRLSQLIAAEDGSGTVRLYHASSGLMASLILPAGAVLALFSYQVILLWTGDAVTAARASPIASLLAIGTMINGLMYIPYALQLAHGWTSIGLRINMVWVVVLVPSVIVMSLRFGAVGAAGVWAGLNLVYILAGVPLTHRKVLRGEGRKWFVKDILPSAAAAFAIAGAGLYLYGRAGTSLAEPWKLMLVAIGTLAASWVASPLAREQVKNLVGDLRSSQLR